MNFYTNVIQWGNNLLVREVKNGQRTNSKVRYSPTLYAPVEKQIYNKKILQFIKMRSNPKKFSRVYITRNK